MNKLFLQAIKAWLLHAMSVTLLIIFMAMGVWQPVYAEDKPEETEEASEDGGDGEEGEGTAPSTAIYLPIKPAFVVNYGGAGRLKYLKTEMSIRLADSAAANAARHHLPYIRNNLVLLFASQTDESLESQHGKEQLRQQALEEVRTILREEDQQDGVVDIYFNSFILQK